MNNRVKKFNLARIAPPLAVSAAAFIALSLLSEPKPMPDAGKFWGAFALMGANEAESYEQLEGMRDAADRVVQARMLNVGISRVIQGDAPEDKTLLVKGEFVSERDIRGHSQEKFSVEFIFPHSVGEAGTVLKSMAATIPQEPVLLFLRKKRDGSGEWRLVNFSGLWTRVNGVLRAPLAEEAEARYADELAEARSVEELGTRVAEL
jgi:hypothetical protein